MKDLAAVSIIAFTESARTSSPAYLRMTSRYSFAPDWPETLVP